ncbi:MAG: sigma-70 family RNA polymerase sigma factor [Acaryochloris sp. RU_4_1]|nr:sigma-70 family RNA polymerase sigma factor [Acaryochloris sp. RU_4_1]
MAITNSAKRKGLTPSPEIFAAIKHQPKLLPEQEAELILKAQNGDQDARDQVIYANLAWVCSVGSGLSGNCLTDEELITEGYFGLNRAIDTWRPEKGANIRTYSTKRIFKAQTEALQQSELIRLPKTAHEQRAKLGKVRTKLGKEITTEQLAEETGIRKQRVELLESVAQPISLNVFVGDGEVELLDLQADEGDEAVSLSEEVVYFLEKLDPQEQKVIKLHFWEKLTYQAISDTLKLSVNTIKRIYKNALNRLRRLLSGEEEILEVDILPRSEPQIVPTQPLVQWEYFIYAKFILGAGLSRILKKAKSFVQRITGSFGKTKQTSSKYESATFSPTGLLLNTNPLTPRSVVNGRQQVITHQADSGGLRDGPQPFLDYCWYGLSCLAQFLGYWTGPPCRSGQPRCRLRDRWRGRGQLKGCCWKKKTRLRNCQKIPLVDFYWPIKLKGEPTIKFANNINSFSRQSIYQLKSKLANSYS